MLLNMNFVLFFNSLTSGNYKNIMRIIDFQLTQITLHGHRV